VKDGVTHCGPAIRPVVLPAAGPDSTGCFGCLHGAKGSPTVKELVSINSNTFIWTMRSVRRSTVPSPTLTANNCTTPMQKHPVTCSISGLSGGSLSRIVTTQVTHPGKQGTPRNCFAARWES
jgi:hypothetical protein